MTIFLKGNKIITEEQIIAEEVIQYLEEKLLIVNNGQKFNQVMILAGGAGCYPKGTEFFTPDGWKNIEYYNGEKVLEIDPENLKGRFVDAEEYINVPATSFYNISNKKVDFTTSEDHKHLVINNKTNKKEIKFTHELVEKHNSREKGNVVSLINTFDFDGCGIDYTDEYIMLKIAVIADGHFIEKRSGNLCRISIKKERKIERLIKLLNDNNIEFRQYTENGFERFEFQMDNKEKEFENYWYNANKHQQKIIIDEVLQWDGSVTKRENRSTLKSFSSTSKKSIDFIQFVFSANGIRSFLRIDDRPEKYSNGVCYSIIFSEKYINSGISKDKRNTNTTEITKIEHNEDEKMYCFTVPSGFFLVRQNNQIYVSGNSGKGFTIEKFTNAIDSYKVIDVDEYKKAVLKFNNLDQKKLDKFPAWKKFKDDHPEVSKLNLRTPKDVSKLHQIVIDLGLAKNVLGNLGASIASADPSRKPNLLFDKTAKSLKDISKVIDYVTSLGYDSKDIHIVWAFTDFRVAMQRNKERSRVVPDDILFGTHEGASKTMMDVIRGAKKISNFNGEFYVVNNNSEFTMFFDKSESEKDWRSSGKGVVSNADDKEKKNIRKTTADKAKDSTDRYKGSGKATATVKDFTYIKIKERGKAIEMDKKTVIQILTWFVKNAPKTKETENIFDWIKNSYPEVKI